MPSKTVVLLTAWLCIPLSGFFSPARAEISDILPRVKQSIAGVGTVHPLRSPRNKLLGTGFVVADGRHVVTNAHVAAVQMELERGESLAVFLRGPDGIITRKAEKVVSDADHDLVLLKLEGDPLPAMALARSERVREGHLYFFTGFPIGAAIGLYPATHRAGLAAIAPIFTPPSGMQNLTAKLIRRADNPFLMFQLDATAYPGNSGSPLYDGDSGGVIGVINAVFVKGSKEHALSDPSGITYAIPSRYVQDLIERAGLRANLMVETGDMNRP